MSFTAEDASLLLVWLIFVLIQFYYPTKQRDLDYYNTGRPHLYIFRIPWDVYPFIFLVTYGPLIPSIFLFLKWHVNVDITVYILFISLLILVFQMEIDQMDNCCNSNHVDIIYHYSYSYGIGSTNKCKLVGSVCPNDSILAFDDSSFNFCL